jgi:hypothetical protein
VYIIFGVGAPLLGASCWRSGGGGLRHARPGDNQLAALRAAGAILS